MKKWGIRLVILLGIIAISLIVRQKNYYQLPLPGDSIDEYSNAWVGLSLIELGRPVGVSSDISGYDKAIKAYINTDRIYQSRGGDPMILRQNWFDHPPLVGLVAGGWVWLKGGRVFEDTVTVMIRRPMVLIGTVTTVLVFALGWMIFSFEVASLGALIYALSPVVVFGSRTVQGENLMIPVSLLALILVLLSFRVKNKWLVVAAGVMAGVATLMKLSGIYTLIAGIGLIVWRGREQKEDWKLMLGYFLVAAVPVAGLFLVYGLALDWGQFWAVLVANGSRGYGLGTEALGSLLKMVGVAQRNLADPWVTIGWIVALGATMSLGKICLLAYLLVFILFGGNGYSWYYLPFFPFLDLILADFLVASIKEEKRGLMAIILLLLGGGEIWKRWLTNGDYLKIVGWWRLGVVVILGWILWRSFGGGDRRWGIVTRVVLVGLIALNLAMSWGYIWGMTVGKWSGM